MQFEDLINQRDNETKILIAEINSQAEAQRFAMMNADTDGVEPMSEKDREALFEKEKILDLYRLNILSLAELQDQLRKIDDARAALLDELNNVPVPVKPSQSPLIIKKKIMAIIDKNPDSTTRQKIFRLTLCTRMMMLPWSTNHKEWLFTLQ